MNLGSLVWMHFVIESGLQFCLAGMCQQAEKQCSGVKVHHRVCCNIDNDARNLNSASSQVSLKSRAYRVDLYHLPTDAFRCAEKANTRKPSTSTAKEESPQACELW